MEEARNDQINESISLEYSIMHLFMSSPVREVIILRVRKWQEVVMPAYSVTHDVDLLHSVHCISVTGDTKLRALHFRVSRIEGSGSHCKSPPTTPSIPPSHNTALRICNNLEILRKKSFIEEYSLNWISYLILSWIVSLLKS